MVKIAPCRAVIFMSMFTHNMGDFHQTSKSSPSVPPLATQTPATAPAGPPTQNPNVAPTIFPNIPILFISK